MIETEWLDYWDDKIAGWVNNVKEEKMMLGFLSKAYKGSGKSELVCNVMSESYVGDPTSNDICAVYLTLNPGRDCPEQSRPNGVLTGKVKDCSYRGVAKEHMIPKTQKWWEKHSRRPVRLMGKKIHICTGKVFGIDIIPWHSKNW